MSGELTKLPPKSPAKPKRRLQRRKTPPATPLEEAVQAIHAVAQGMQVIAKAVQPYVERWKNRKRKS